MDFKRLIVCSLLSVLLPGLAFSQTVGNTHIVRLDSLAVQPSDTLAIDAKYETTFEMLANLDEEDYDALVIPPLSELFEAAVSSASVKSAQATLDVAKYELITVRRQWLQWLKMNASYSFGNSDMYAVQLLETTNQIWTYNQRQQQQMFWNIGAGISIPLSDLFTHGNKVRQQKARIRAAEAERDMAYQEVKNLVISYYVDAVKQLNLFKVYAENYAAAESQYFISEQDFINGELSVHDLFIMKNYQSGAKLEYEQCKAALNQALLCLEVVTGMPIISNMKKKLNPKWNDSELPEAELDARAKRRLQKEQKRAARK